jgi:hypothetical protein
VGVVRLATSVAAHDVVYIVGWFLNSTLEEYGRKRSWPEMRYYPSRDRTQKSSVRIYCLRSEIRTRKLSNVKARVLATWPPAFGDFVEILIISSWKIAVPRKLVSGSVIGWGTMLQAGRLPVRVPGEVDFINLPNPSSQTMAPRSTQPLTKMSTRNSPGGKKLPARRADNLTDIYEPIVWKCGSLNLSQP